jgi:hypothetical protein
MPRERGPARVRIICNNARSHMQWLVVIGDEPSLRPGVGPKIAAGPFLAPRTARRAAERLRSMIRHRNGRAA